DTYEESFYEDKEKEEDEEEEEESSKEEEDGEKSKRKRSSFGVQVAMVPPSDDEVWAMVDKTFKKPKHMNQKLQQHMEKVSGNTGRKENEERWREIRGTAFDAASVLL